MSTDVAKQFLDFVQELSEENQQKLLEVLCKDSFKNQSNDDNGLIFDNSRIQNDICYLNFLNELSSSDGNNLTVFVKKIANISYEHAPYSPIHGETVVRFDDNTGFHSDGNVFTKFDRKIKLGENNE
jgi:hypothetical protein